MASTISFSGLSASGLDTSSWVDALVSVKQQTVTSLESQKAEKENLLSIVNNIKSYFSSFQSCLQKLTDSQYGIASMDLFMQNLALSSNANIATATATTEAARQSYDVAVDSLATATKATSGYSQFEVKTADLNTTFGTLGGKNGTITVNSQSFNVTTDDTLGSLVDKFKNVGVDASFDEKKGTFTVGIDLDKIDEGATNLKNALKLKNNNVSGAVSGSIVYANRSTEFSKLGLTAGKITIEGIEHTIAKNGDNYTIQKAGGSAVSMNTLGEFFDYLKSSAVGAEDASVDGKGNITIKGATLDKVEGGSNLMEVLNLIESQKRTVSESGALSYVEVRNADLNTKLSALGVTGDTTLVAGGTNNTISNDKTLGDIQKILKNAGVEMNVDNRGVITIDTKGNEISGTLLDVLNLDPTKGGTTISSSAHQANLKADLNTKLSELGVKDSDKYIAYKSDGTAMTVEMTNLADKSINTLITDLKNVGLDANFDEKTHQIVIKDGYITGTLADVLGMTQSTTSYTENATLNTTLSALGATGDSTLTIDGGSAKTYGKDTTLETVFGDIKDAGGKVTFKDGNVTIEGVTLGGSIPALLGLDATTQGTSVTSGKLTAVTGSSSTGGGNNATVEHDIDLNTKIGDITGTTSSYTLKVDDGTSKTYTKDTTLQELKNQIESAGGKFTINDDNTISIDGVTMSGTLVGVLGFDELETGTRFTTVDSVMISGTSNVATGDTTLGNLGLISGSTSGARAVRRAPANPNKTLSINGGAAKSYGANSSLDDIFADIVAAGGTASIDDEGYINIKGVHLEGTLVDALGLVETDYKTTITSGNLKVTTSTSSTSSSVLYSEQKGDISLSSTVGSIVGDSESYNLVVNGTNNTIGTNTKLSDIRTIIQNAGGTMTVNDDNTISVNGVEISGSLVDKLGFMSNGVHTVVSSNNPIYYTDGKKSADSGSTFEQLGISADKRDFAIYKNDGTLVKASSTTGSASGKTIGDWLKTINDALNSANGTSGSVYATINNGVISISGGYVTGSLPTELGIGTTQTVTGITMEGNSVTYTEYDPLKYIGNIQTGSGTAAGNVTSTGMIGAVVEYTDEVGNVLQANENTKLADILDTSGNKLGSGSFTFNVGSYTKTFDADSTTLGDVRDYVNNLNTDTTYDTNTSASIADGKIAIESNVDITGTLMSALGFAKSDVSSIAYEIKGTNKAHYSSVDSTTYTASGFTKATETKTGNVTIASLELPSGFATSLNIVDTSDAISLSSVSSESSLVNGKKYSISTKEDLIKLAEFSKSWNYYGSNRSNIVWVLTNDIDMSGVTDFTGVEYLFGTFSGNGHVIKNLTINDNSTYVGLFKTSKGTIQDLGLENANVTRGEDSTTYITSVGVLVGRNEGNIQNCYANNSTVTAGNGVDYAGGLVGFSEGSSKITYSWTNVQVNCASTKAGGFVGAIQGDSSTDNPIVSKCFSVSNLRTDKNAGFCGDLKYYYPKIQDCFSVGINSGVCSSTATYIEYQQANDNSLTKVSSGSLVSLKSKIDALGFDNLNWNVEEKELRVSEADSFESGMTYHISTVADLQKLSSYSNTRNSSGLNGIDEGVNFVLDNDIDMSSVSNFVGIANFKGNFYGNGHVIKNLKISESSSGGYVGLFKSIDGTVQDLGLENVTITTNNSYGYTPRQMSVGALVGELFNGKIENCYVSGGTISGNATYMGGLVGSNKWNGGTISDCWANVTVNKTSYSKDKIGAVGGLVALSGGSISNSYSLGDVNSAYGYVGGFVGIATGTISNSFSTGNVKVTNSSSSNTTYTGGFAGAFGMTWTMKNDYSLDDDVTVNMSNNYSTGTVTAAKGSVGGFVGTIITSSSGTSASDYTMSNNFSDSGSASKAIGSGSVSGISAVANSEINSGISGLGFSNLTMTEVVSEHTATTSTKISDLMGKGGSQTLTLTPTAGGEAVTLTFNETDTIQTVIDKLKAQGIDEADLTDGVFRVKDDKQWTISGALANKLFGGTDDVYTFTGSKVTYTTTGAGTVGSVTGDKLTYTTTTGSTGSVTGNQLTYTKTTTTNGLYSNRNFVANTQIYGDSSIYQSERLHWSFDANTTIQEFLEGNADLSFEELLADNDLINVNGVAVEGLSADMTLGQLCQKMGWIYNNGVVTIAADTQTTYEGSLLEDIFGVGYIELDPSNTPTKTYVSSVTGSFVEGQTYYIKSATDLMKIGGATEGITFVLDADIDMEGNGGWISEFKGTFYGNGHKISNLGGALFSTISGSAIVKDIGVENSYLADGSAFADVIEGNAKVENCYVKNGTIEITSSCHCDNIGGFAGEIKGNATVSNSFADVNIVLEKYGSMECLGGFVGRASRNAQIDHSYSSGSIRIFPEASVFGVGGFAGVLSDTVSVSDSYSTLDMSNAKVVDAHNYGSFVGVAGGINYGGGVEYEVFSGSIKNVYTTDETKFAGMVSGGTFENVIYNKAAEGELIYGTATDAFLLPSTALTTSQMQDATTMQGHGFTVENGWYFVGGGESSFIETSASSMQMTVSATGTTKMSELGITDFTVNGSALSGITSSSTVNDVLAKLKSTYGLSEATISDGKITFKSTTDTTLSGNLIKGLTGQDSVTITPTAGDTTTHTATGTTKMSELGITDFKVNGSALSGITGDSTVDDVLAKLKSTYGLSEATIADGKITLKSNTDTTLSGNLIKGLTGQDSVTITPTAGAVTTNTATENTTLGDLGLTSFDLKINGTSISGLSADSKISDVFAKLADSNITATMTDGKITLTSNEATTLSGTVAEKLLGSSSVTLAGDSTEHTFDMEQISASKALYTSRALTYNSGTQKVSEVTELVAGNKYHIASEADLVKLAEFVNSGADTTGSIFIFDNDIDMSSVANFTSIGNDASHAFKGTIYGNGHVVKNLKIDSTSDYQGLFGYVQQATIQDLGVEDANIKGGAYSGILFGRAENAKLTNLYATGTVSGSSFVGGLVGSLKDSVLEKSYSTATVNVSKAAAGGLVGSVVNSTLETVYATGDVNCTASGVGALAGTGGLVGTMQSGGTIKNAFATGSVTTKSGGFNGGLIGWLTDSSSYTIDTVYATGNVTGSGGTNGGLIGTINASSVTITNAIYNKNSVSNGVGNGSFDGITGKNFEQMLMKSVMQNAGFTEDKGWVYKDGATPTFGNMTVSGGGGKVYLDDTITSFTSGSAYYISSLEQLNKLASLVNSGASTAGVSFILENDIDVSAFTTAIGSTEANAFKGTFYGNGHVLTGLKTNLFDNIDGEAVIRDLGLENMTGSGHLASSVAGNSTIDNVYSTGSTTVSGLVNKLGGSATIKNSYSTATVNSSSASAGGLVAQMADSATIDHSYFGGRVQVGSYYTAGGLVGSMAGGTIKSSYSTASIASGDVLRGGLVGEVTGSVTIQNSYASGTTDGGLIGENSGSVTSSGNVYNSANSNAVGSGSSISGLTAISLADMKSQSKMEALGFTASNGWHYYAGKTPMLQGKDISSAHSVNVSLSTKIDSILNSGEGRNVKVTANGTTYEKWFEPTDTVKDVRDWLNTIDGVTATFDETNSTFKVSGTSEDFKIDGDLASALFGGRKTTTKTSATVNTDSNELLVDGSQTKITNNTTVGQLLGKASGNYAIGFYDDNGNLVTKKFGVDTKLSEVLQYLKDNGFEASITNGVFTASKDGNTTTDILGTIGNKLKGETGTVTTTDTGYRTGVLGLSSSVKATASTKLSELGIDSGSILIKDNNNNNLGTIQINNSMTIDDTAQLLANYGFTLTITDGKVTVAGEGINRLADGTSNLVSKMKLDNWTETKDKLKTTSTVAQMGFAKGSILGLVLDNKTYNLTFDANATLQDIIDTLGTYGVTASVDSDGKFTATASGNLVLTNELGAYLTKNSAEGYVKEADGYKSKDPLEFKGDKVKLDYDSKVGDILGTGKDGVLRLTIDNTTVVDLRYRADETMSDIIADLKGYGITATINDGVLTAVSDGHTFRFSGEIGKIISGDTPLYEDISTGYKSKDLSYETTGKATLDNTLKEMGISSGQIHVLSNDGKIVSTLDIDDSYTVAQVKSLLQPFGMDLAIDADGKVTVTSSEGYKLSDGTSNMVSTMKLNSWTTTTEKLTGATTLSQMGFKDGADLNLFLDGAVMNVLSFNADQTLDDISFALSAYGIDASVNADGQFTATSKTHTFIMSGGLGSYLTKGTGGYVNSDTDYKSYKPLTEEHPYITDTSKEIGYKKLMTESSTLDSLGFAQGGSVRIMLDGTTPYSLEFLATDTVQDVIYALSAYGINAEVKDGKFVAESVNNTFTITGNFGSYLVQGGAYNNEVTGYESAPLTYNTTEKLTNDTKLSSLGVTRGAINVIKDGKVADTINITNDTTIGQLFSAIKPYGMSGSIVTDASGNTSIRISADSDIKLADGTSNVVSALGLQDVRQGDFEGHKEYWDDDATSGLITEGMLLSSLDRNGFIAQGSLIFTTGEGDDAVQHIINITADETVGSLLKKFNDSGIKAELDNGIIKFTGGLDKLTFNGGTSGLVNTIGLDIHNIDKYASSSSALTYEGETHYSASNFANANTTLDIVNTTDGIMSVFVDGIKCNVEVKSSDTFAKLFKKIKDTVKAKSGLDIEAGFMTKDGTISTNPTDANNTGIIALSVAEGHELVIGASNDTTNFATIANLNKTGYNTITGSRALYRVNVNSLITQSGLYRDGDITEGTFIIGDAEFTIDSTTTLSSLIDQINKNDKAYANAYWDTLSGTLVIQSTNTGASLINIEAGTSNFTDIMGFTKTKDGVSALVTDSQTLGQNAVVRINGTTVTSATNVITSDISRIKGLTINLKNVSEGETVTITVEQDKESIYNAVSDTLDSYNAMMEALNKELSDRSSLGGESILKLMRNNLKRLMTSSLTGAYVFKNLASVGISTGQASDDISTNVTSLLIDKDKFMDALNTDSDAVQDLLVGTKANPGIFLQANNIVESSIKTDGYFSNMANTLTKSINNIDKKITKTNNDIENYRTKLQSKFHNMELTISGLQSAYANLLGQG